MTYEEARAFAEEAAKSGSVLGLESITDLMHELSDVQDDLPVIHIAGTNGKGSVGAYLDAIFREAGLHTGRFSSPAVYDDLEVWQYDGQNISREEYAELMTRVRSACERVVEKGGNMPTIFEIETAVAFVWFAEKRPDVVMLETGMGGLTDATNIIQKPLCSVITPISLEHTAFLGKSLEEIAAAKAGIIKEGCPVYSALQEPEVEAVIRDRAQELCCPIGVVKDEKIRLLSMTPKKMNFYYKDLQIESSMVGTFQMRNAALAVKTAYYRLPELLKNEENDYMGALHLYRIARGLKKAVWPGRFEVVREDPFWILDGAHNVGAVRQLHDTVRLCFGEQKLNYIVGVLEDKEYDKMLECMSDCGAKVCTVTPCSNRAINGRVLEMSAKKYYNKVIFCESLAQAVGEAKEEGRPVLVFGSLSYLGAIREEIQK